MENNKILQCKGLDISFRNDNITTHVIRGVDLELERGKTLAIVGESGSGKTITMKAIMGLLPENAQVNSGEIIFSYLNEGRTLTQIDLFHITKRERIKQINGKRISMIFQNPMTSLNPTMKIGRQITEIIERHLHMPSNEARKRAVELLNLVGIEEAEERMKNYPHQFSGGMRQRVVIAIALACNPDLVICDESTSALDATVQVKILELIKDIQKKLSLSVIFITHDLGVVASVADNVAVMYAGKIVEQGTVEEVFYNPCHPYTWGLLMSIPDIGYSNECLFTIKGSPPRFLNDIKGDAFRDRNLYALNIDSKEEPPMFKISDTHYAASWLLDKRAPDVDIPPELKRYIDMLKNGDGIHESGTST